jgi:hypothetical protein
MQCQPSNSTTKIKNRKSKIENVQKVKKVKKSKDKSPDRPGGCHLTFIDTAPWGRALVAGGAL